MEQEREEKRKKEEKRQIEDSERKDRHHQLLQQLQNTQPPVPQTVHVSQTILPSMKESDDIVEFIRCLEMTLRSASSHRETCLIDPTFPVC